MKRKKIITIGLSLISLISLISVLLVAFIILEIERPNTAQHGHECFVNKRSAITDPTCTAGGYTTYICECGKSYTDDHTDALGHTLGEWRETKAPAYPEGGEEACECTVCGHIEVRKTMPSVVDSGFFGAGYDLTDKVIYTLYSDGTLLIEGEGALYGYKTNGNDQPFMKYRKQIKHLIIGEGITETTYGSFAQLSSLESVVFPSTLTRLPQYAFMSSFCESVTEITLPKTIAHIGKYSLGHYTGEPSAYFTDIFIENPDVDITDDKAVFNGGAKLDSLTLYSYGKNNKVSAYASKYGIRYIDINEYVKGKSDGIGYTLFEGTLTLEALSENAVIPVKDQPWSDYIKGIKKIVLESGIEEIPGEAFCDYTSLTEVILPVSLKSVGDKAFAVSGKVDSPLKIKLPKRIEVLGKNIFFGRKNVDATVYSGSLAEKLDEDGVKLTLKKEFKLLLIGNSYTDDASSYGQGMTDSMLLRILEAMLGENAEITVGAVTSGGKGINWHATQAEAGNRNYQFKYITSDDNVWKTYGSASSKEALLWTDWDVVSLQHYGLNVNTGKEGVPYPEQTDTKFYKLETASEYMLDYIAESAPYADIYFYMHWARTNETVLNAGLSTYNQMAGFIPQVLNYKGEETGAQFKNIIPVGLSVQNARSTYLALLSYNTSAYADGNLNLNTDAQIGLQRDTGHLSFNIGRYIAGLTFAEIVIPDEMREDGYVLPDIRVTESIGVLPKEYTKIAQKSVFAAVEAWKEKKLSVTEISGYTEDPAVTAGEKIRAMTLPTLSGNEEMMKAQIREAVMPILSEDILIERIAFDTSNKSVSITVRFGYTSVTVEKVY